MPNDGRNQRTRYVRGHGIPSGEGAVYEAREGARTGSDVRAVSRQAWGRTKSDAGGKKVRGGDSIRADR